MNELKIFVERCVRPVILEESGKLRMRRELYAHVCQAYEQELANAENDAQVALERTLNRMGDPRELTAELQSTVGTFDRWTGHIDALMHRPVEMPLWRYASRVTVYFGGPFIVLLLIVLASRLAGLIPNGDHAISEVRFVGALGFVWLVNEFVCTMIYGRVCSYFYQQYWAIRQVLEVASLAIIAAVDVLCLGWLFTFLASGNTDFFKQVPYYWGILAIFAALAIIVVAWLGEKQVRGLQEWRELEIDA